MSPSDPPSVPPRLTDAVWLHRPQTQAVFAALAAAGYEARAVGGAVRNTLIGRPVVDVDLATTAPPEAVISAAKAAGLHPIATGIAHGTITVVSGHVPHEVTTLREDVETFGRHARVAFTADWASDAHRRDFTMNALYCDATGAVLDPVDGYGDLLAGRVRFIGDAGQRIAEDGLRILRFFRFNAEYGQGAPDADGLAACVAARGALALLSGERLQAELLKLVVAPRAVDMAEVMADAGILDDVLAGPIAPDLLRRIVRLESALARGPDAVLRLATLVVLGRPEGERAGVARHACSRLKLSSADARRLRAAAQPSPVRGASATRHQVRVALYRSGRAVIEDALLLDWTDAGDPPGDAVRRQILEDAVNLPVPVLPVRGADVLALGVPPGPRVGRAMAAFEDWWIAADMPSDDALIAQQLTDIVATLGLRDASG